MDLQDFIKKNKQVKITENILIENRIKKEIANAISNKQNKVEMEFNCYVDEKKFVEFLNSIAYKEKISIKKIVYEKSDLFITTYHYKFEFEYNKKYSTPELIYNKNYIKGWLTLLAFLVFVITISMLILINKIIIK